MQLRTIQGKLTDEVIVDLVRSFRNNFIKSLLVGDNLVEDLSARHSLSDLSPVRIEFMKRTLQNLLIAPVDLEHYGKLILEIRGVADPEHLLKHRSHFFADNVDQVLKTYIY